MSLVRPRTRRPRSELEQLQSRVDMIVDEQDRMKTNINSQLEGMKKEIKYIGDRLDRMIETYRDEYHAMYSTNKGK